MIDKHLMKLRARSTISQEEERAIRSAVSEVREYRGRYTFINRTEQLNHSTLLIEGLICRYKDLRSGGRQVSELHVAGDFADLHSFTLKYLDQNLMTLTPCRVGIVSHDRLREITEQHPQLARIYWFETNIDAAIHREWELSLGRRSALSRLASLFCEMHVRLGIVGLASATHYDLPLTQNDLAECLGLTPVHVNRTLKQLRERQVMDFRRGKVNLIDLDALRRIAEFDPSYLYLDRRQS